MPHDDRAEKYIATRYRQMLDWYDARAVSSKAWYRRLSVYVILASFVLVPVASLTFIEYRIITTILSCTIGAATALLAHFKFHEDWLRYRSTWDSLNRERALFDTLTGTYAGHADPVTLFVERCEALFCQEGTKWYSEHSCKEQPSSRAREHGDDKGSYSFGRD